MYEVELKVRVDHDTVRKQLDEIGAQRIDTVTQEDVYYDAPDRDFAATDEALRIRTVTADETETRLTYKGPLVETQSKTRREAETAVADPEEIRTILDGLGYEPAATVRKQREQYTVDGCTVTLDAVDGLGEFVEAELEIEDGIDDARNRLESVFERLGLDPADQIRTSYLGLLLAEEDTDQATT